MSWQPVRTWVCQSQGWGMGWVGYLNGREEFYFGRENGQDQWLTLSSSRISFIHSAAPQTLDSLKEFAYPGYIYITYFPTTTTTTIFILKKSLMSFMNRRDSVHDIILATAKKVNVFLDWANLLWNMYPFLQAFWNVDIALPFLTHIWAPGWELLCYGKPQHLLQPGDSLNHEVQPCFQAFGEGTVDVN